MPKTTRTRAVNLYTVTADGQPVAQAEAISQAEAVALYVESQQQPTLSARLATPMDARKLAHLPLLTRGAQPDRDQRVGDLLDTGPASPPDYGHFGCDGSFRHPFDTPVMTLRGRPITEIVLAEVMATYCPPVDLGADHIVDAAEMVPPQHAPIAAVVEGLASGEPVAVDCAHSADLPADASRASADAPAQERRRLFPDPPKGAGKVEAKYRNPETGESWSGRGLKPKWLVMAIEAGRALEDFLI